MGLLGKKKEKCPHETAREEETSTKTQEIDLNDLMRTGIN